jgi:DNA-binding response OmpR family regulator
MKILVVDDERDMKLGADDFLTKPLEFGILKEKIKAIL